MLTVYTGLEYQLLVRPRHIYVYIKTNIIQKKTKTKIQYADEFVQKLGMGDPTTCVYQLIYNEKDTIDTKIIQYFIMHGLGFCIKLDIYVSHMFYTWSFINNTAVLIAIHKNIFPFLEYKHYYIFFGIRKSKLK